MKIVVAGKGKVGSTLCRQLTTDGHDVTLIDTDANVLSAGVDRYDVMTVEGNCATKRALELANVYQQDLLIATTGDDVVNMLSCLTAHKLNPRIHTIARIRDPEYLDQTYLMQEDFGLSMTINPEKQAADEIADLVFYPGFLKRETLAKSRAQIVELLVDKDSPLRNVTLSALPGRVRCRVLVCTVVRNGRAEAPGGNFMLKEGDRIFVTAPTDVLPTLLKNLGITTRKVRRVMIAGGDRIGFYLAKQLLANNIAVCLIDNDENRCHELATLLPEADIICGDASNRELLNEERIKDTDTLVSLTGMDELNMVISMYGSAGGVPQVITKLSREENSRLLYNLPIGSIICPRRLSSDTIVTYIRAMQNQQGAALSMHTIADGQATIMEFAVNESTRHLGVPLKDLHLKKNILIVAITRAGVTTIPNGSTTFDKGDDMVIVTGDDVIVRNINDIFD